MDQNLPATNIIVEDQRIAAIHFLNRVHGWMAGGLLVTAIAAGLMADYIRKNGMSKEMFYGAIIAQFGLVLLLSWLAPRLAPALASLMFVVYAALTGVTLSVLLLMYTAATVATAFYITAGTFAAMAVIGTVTKKDLTTIGNICFVGLIGIVIAGIVNIFMQNSMLQFVISCITVVVFCGLTAYDSQKLKEMHEAGEDRHGLVILGALTLYLDFINLFIAILRIIGGSRR